MPYIPIVSGQCGHTKECKTNKCIFRLIGCFGFPAGCYYPGVEDVAKKAMEKAEVDDVILPDLKATTGTNVIYVTCEDMTGCEI